MPSKGGYEHSIDVSAEAMPSEQDLIMPVSLFKLCFYYWMYVNSNQFDW